MEKEVIKTCNHSVTSSTYANENKRPESVVLPNGDTEYRREKRSNSHGSNDGEHIHDHIPHQSPFSFRGRYFDSPNRDINVASPWFLCNRPQPGGFNCAIHAGDGPPSFVPGVVNQFNNKPFMMPQQLFADDPQAPYPAHFIYTPPYTFPPPTMPWPSRPPHYAFPQPRFNSIYTTQPIAVPNNVAAFQAIPPRCFTHLPRNLSPPNNLVTFSAPNSVELIVSNLDYNISAKEWRKILFTTFHPQVQVLNVFVKTQPDNTSIAMVKVPSIEDGRFAISQFHRKKIGYKRIHVTLKNDDSQYLTNSTRTEVVALLSEVHGGVLPLFKFIELFDKRYHRPISVSELYKMKDIIEISEQGGAGRMIYLRGSNAPSPETCSEPEVPPVAQEILEVPVCQKHCENTRTLNYIMAMNCSMLPTVRIGLKILGTQVHSLLQDHEGSMHLMSFTACYEAKFPPLVTSESGVPLEHLISCVPGVQIKVSKSGMKKVQWTENKQLDSPGSTSSQGSCSPLLTQQLSQISRELVDLLKHSPNTRMPFTKFIPAYHHHFGRQCRVADYGYTRLYELFEAIPHVLQVMGVGDRKVLTLTHRAQARRFTSDILRVLKTYPTKEMSLSILNDAFEKVHGKALEVTDYGVCDVTDMLNEITPLTILVTQEGGETMLSIPKKDQSSEECERTKQFCVEVKDLLKHNPQCRMPFNKFIPAYHHHFGRQCRVSDYGFTKLLELFECLPNLVKQIDDGDERIVALTQPELCKVMTEQIARLLYAQPSQRVPLSDFHLKFSSHYGFTILLADFGVDNIQDLLAQFKHIVRIEGVNGEPYVVLLRRGGVPLLAHQILLLLMNQSGGSLPLVELCSRYRSTFDAECDVQRVRDELIDYVQVSGDDQSAVISLTQLQSFARDMRNLLLTHSSQLPFHRVDFEYLQKFGVEIKPTLFGHTSVYTLLCAIPHIVTVKGTGVKRVLHLAPEFQNSSMSVSPVSPVLYQHDHNFNDLPADCDSYSSSLHDPYLSTPYTRTSDSSGFVSGLPSFESQLFTTSPELLAERQARDANKLPSPKELVWSGGSDPISSQARSAGPTSEQLHLAAQCLPGQQSLPEVRAAVNGHHTDMGPLTVKTETRGGYVERDGGVGPKVVADAFINKFTGGWWKASTEQLQNLPIIKSHIEKMKSGDERIAEHKKDGRCDGQEALGGQGDGVHKITAAYPSDGSLKGGLVAHKDEVGIFEMDTNGFVEYKSSEFGEKCRGDDIVEFANKSVDNSGDLHVKISACDDKRDAFDDFKIPCSKPAGFTDKAVHKSVYRDEQGDKCSLPRAGGSRCASPEPKCNLFGTAGLCHISKLLDFNVNEIKLDRSYELRSKLRKPTRSDTTSIFSSITIEGTSANNSFLDDIPIDTSSVKSDDCGAEFRSAHSPPKKNRIAANFAAPYQMSWNY